MTTHDLFSDLDLTRARLVRHKLVHPRRAFLYPEAFAGFQEVQRAGAFGDAAFVLSFVPDRGTAVRFVGAWSVDAAESGADMPDDEVERLAAAERELGQPLTREHVRTVWRSDQVTHYTLSRVGRYDHLIGDLVVDWGPGARAWVQRADRQPKRAL